MAAVISPASCDHAEQKTQGCGNGNCHVGIILAYLMSCIEGSGGVLRRTDFAATPGNLFSELAGVFVSWHRFTTRAATRGATTDWVRYFDRLDLLLLPAFFRAIATACFCGLPAFISVLMFELTVLCDEPFLSGMVGFPLAGWLSSCLVTTCELRGSLPETFRYDSVSNMQW
jgi:hypothetical protein